MSQPNKILIVGAGLSGVCVSLQLIRRGVDVTVIGRAENESSVIAAGMINPIVFRRMTKSWRVDEFLPYLMDFYTALEKETKHSFLLPITIRRLFSHAQERDLWLEKQDHPDFQDYLFPLNEADKNYSKCINHFGSGRVKNSYSIDAKSFLAAAKSVIAAKGKWVTADFDYSKLIGNTYMNDRYDVIVFCEGYHSINNPWFSYLPINPTKGETLTIVSPILPEDESLNRKCFVLPLGNQRFKIGSTYVWDTPKSDITVAGKHEILNNLSCLTEEEVEVIEHEAGVRPTTRDRRPFIGCHPDHPSYFIFNGLGAKGYMLAPLLSKECVDFLLDNSPLDSESSIDRVSR
jgi:glycine oxidase